MNRDDRLTELKKLGNIHGYTLSTEDVFSEWQGRISALLNYDPIAKHKFERYCDFILDDHEFGRGLISYETVEAQKKIHVLIERVMADLEINRPDVSPPIPADFSIPDPVVIPDTAGFGHPDLEITRDTDIAEHSSKHQDLTKEEGLLWFWHHSNYLVKWRFIALAATVSASVFWLGWVANEQEFFRDLARAFQKLHSPPASQAGEEDGTNDRPKDPNDEDRIKKQ